MTFKYKKKFSQLIIGFILLNIVIVATDSTYLYKAIFYNFAKIDNYAIFPKRTLNTSPTPQPWPLAKDYNKQALSATCRETLEELESVAFLVFKNDSLLQEHYWDGYSYKLRSNSFSMAKSYVSTLIGCALKDGYIHSLDQSAGDFVPSMRTASKKHISIRNLLQMSSGLNWEESYMNPFSVTTKAYYGSDITTLINQLDSISPPGQDFKYLSGNTQILGMIVEKATGKTLTEYAEEKLWHPMGYEQDAYWSIDRRKGIEKAYCCINSNARDFARIIKLYNHQGSWNGTQILTSDYVKDATTPSQYAKEGFNEYGYQWWLLPKYKGLRVFYARGILGQYAVGIPDKNIIIVRLGRKRGEKIHNHPRELFVYIDEALQLCEHE